MKGLPIVKDIAIAQKMALGYRLRASRTVVACSSLLALATAAVMAAASAVGGIVASMARDPTGRNSPDLISV